MEIWFMIIVTASIAALLNAFISLSKPNSNLPPGPRSVPILSTILWLRKSSFQTEQTLRKLRSKFGPIVTIHVGSRPLIFISDGTLAHQALIQLGPIFADRPKQPLTGKIMSSNQHNITTAGYGPTWRLLRRNLNLKILHPSKSKEFSSARKWALEILLSQLKQDTENNINNNNNISGVVKVIDHFRFAMFCLLVFMCFGDKMVESCIREVEEVVYRPMVLFSRYQILNFWPWMTRVILRSRWNEFIDSRKKQEEVLMPCITARKHSLQELQEKVTTCYVDSLLELELSENGIVKRKLSDKEIVTLCTEFLTGGTDTTSTALQWIMANIVKNPNIQAKLLDEIKGVVGKKAKEVLENDLSKMPYLKAVVLEGLRRHPPFYFVLPHAVTQETEVGGYRIPENAIINFRVADMGLDPEVWDDPMEFRPERFMSSQRNGIQDEFNITGKIKMMPFGAGKRMCPASGLALLHLQYFVANLVCRFEWRVEEGKEVDLTEKQEFTIVMKNPLHAHISPR
ncbi:cytochrome P450 89A2-like [Silene latifolia]|uniref:cytochrome P450 89A2-like n=1 Tax=Silene latifolia TaxID=37657 RepID=UPI003D778EAD